MERAPKGRSNGDEPFAGHDSDEAADLRAFLADRGLAPGEASLTDEERSLLAGEEALRRILRDVRSEEDKDDELRRDTDGS